MSFPFIGCTKTEGLTRSDEVLLFSVLEWYNFEPSRVEKFIQIVERNNGLSLRVIDWLVTNYSKTTSIVIEDNGVPRDLYRDYHKYLSAYNKKNMDPFARRKKISVVIFGNKTRRSTVGQLNFFRWFLGNNLVGYLETNKETIEGHMKDAEQRSKLGKTKTTRKVQTKGSVNSYLGKFVMEFT